MTFTLKVVVEWQQTISFTPAKMTLAHDRASTFLYRENLILVVVLVLESKGL